MHSNNGMSCYQTPPSCNPDDVPQLNSPLTESVQAGQDFGVVVAVQTYAADQELLVNLADDRTGKSGAFTGHPKTLT